MTENKEVEYTKPRIIRTQEDFDTIKFEPATTTNENEGDDPSPTSNE